MHTPDLIYRFAVATTLLIAMGNVQAADKTMPSDATSRGVPGRPTGTAFR